MGFLQRVPQALYLGLGVSESLLQVLRAFLKLVDTGRELLGLSNTTLRRHYPEIVDAVTAVRAGNNEGRLPADTKRYDDLVRRNAKIRRANRELTDQLTLALACIQRLSVDNANLLAALEAASRIRRIDIPHGSAARPTPMPPNLS
ncbi:hypothetical protein ACH5AP_37135 [Streptomyces anulatus]